MWYSCNDFSNIIATFILMIRIKLVLFRHPAVDNIFMIFWEGIKLFSVFCVVSVTSGFNKHCSRFLSTFNSLVEHGMSCTFILQLLDIILCLIYKLHFCVILSKVLVKNYQYQHFCCENYEAYHASF